MEIFQVWIGLFIVYTVVRYLRKAFADPPTTYDEWKEVNEYIDELERRENGARK